MPTTDTPDTIHDGHHTPAPAVDWSPVAAGWDAHGPAVETMKAELTTALLAALDLRPGQSVLELGAGTGLLARRLADAVTPGGAVLATDVAAGMVEVIARNTADLPAVQTAVVDAGDAMALPDAAYDAVVFRMGLMLVPDPARALAEVRRVLVPGGRFAAATWAGPEHNPWLTTVGMSMMLQGLVSGGLPTGPGGPLSLGDPDALHALATGAGLRDVTVRSFDISFTAPDVDAYVEHVTSLAPPLAAGYAAATDEQRAAVRATVTQAAEPFTTADGLVIPGRALVLTATA